MSELHTPVLRKAQQKVEGTTMTRQETETKMEEVENTLKALIGLKVVDTGLIDGVPALRLSDGSTVWIENVAKNGVMVIVR